MIQHNRIVKTHEDLVKILNKYVYIVENYSKTSKLNINSKIIQNDEESSLFEVTASNISENKSLNQSISSVNKQQIGIEPFELTKLNT